MTHRYLATGVGVLIVVLAVLGWSRRAARAGAAGLAVAGRRLTLVWVCVQGAFGALHGDDEALPGDRHRCTCSAASACWRCWRCRPRRYRPRRWPCRRRCAPALVAVAVLGVVQIALGGWVSTNYAVLACRDFPTCQGAWWPAMDFAHGFALLRELGAGARRRLPAVRGADGDPHGASPRRLRRAGGARWLLAWRLRARGGAALARWACGARRRRRLAARQRPGQRAARLAAGSARSAHTGRAAALVVVLTLAARALARRRRDAHGARPARPAAAPLAS